MRKQYKSSEIKNKEITKKKKLMGLPLKGYVASLVILDLVPEMKNSNVGISSD